MRRSSKSRAFARAQEALVLGVDAGDDLLVVGFGVVAGLVGEDELALGAGDAGEEAARLVGLGIDADGGHGRLDDLDLIGVVVDRELGQDAEPVGEDAGILAQETGAEGVEGAHDDAVEGAPLAQLLDARAHLPGGFVGERDGQDALTRDVMDLHQGGDAVGEDAGLTGPRTSDHQDGTVDGQHGFALLFVQPGEEFVRLGHEGFQRRPLTPNKCS